MDWTAWASSVFGSSSEGSGVGYSGQNSASAFTPVTSNLGGIGGIGAFNFGGNPNLQTAFQGVAANPWPWALGAVAIALLVIKFK